MKDFKSYLVSKRIVTEKQLPYYINWVSQCFNYFNKAAEDGISQDEIDQFLAVLGKHKEDWQVDQARDAIDLSEKGYDIRTIQELLGHTSLRTTMIYTHVARKNKLGVRSPLD